MGTGSDPRHEKAGAFPGFFVVGWRAVERLALLNRRRSQAPYVDTSMTARPSGACRTTSAAETPGTVLAPTATDPAVSI